MSKSRPANRDTTRADAILATNTSYLDPEIIAAATSGRESVLGLHFFSPANIMRLVEVVRGHGLGNAPLGYLGVAET